MAEAPTRTPSRRPRISRAYLEAHRRRRFVDATGEILHEFGRRGATTTNVIRLAGGARNSFYEVFSSIEDCIAYGIGLAEAELFAGLEELPGEDGWPTELQAAIGSFYEAVSARPLQAELLLIHSAAARTDAGRLAFRTAGQRFLPLLHRGGAEAEALGRRAPTATVEECLSRSIVELAARRVRSAGLESLAAESAPMALLTGGFYLGREAAEEVLGPAAR
jgi:AcrR family transcriptional regulator